MSSYDPPLELCTYAPDPNDPPEWRHKFGYEQLVINRKIQRWLEAQGETDYFTMIKVQHRAWDIYITNLRAEKAARKAAEPTKMYIDGLNKADMEYLAERLEGVNDPQGQDVLAKLLALLNVQR